MGQPLGGIEYLLLGSTPLNVGETISLSLNAFTRETVAGLTGIVGTVSKPRIQHVEVEVNFTDDDDVKAIVDYSGPVTVRLRAGKTYVLNSAQQVADVDLDGANGKATLRFEAPSSDGPY